MGDETLETVQTLLESVLERTDDSEVHYKLRTALQLLVVHESRLDQFQEVADATSRLEEAVGDVERVGDEVDDTTADLKERLRALGYLD